MRLWLGFPSIERRSAVSDQSVCQHWQIPAIPQIRCEEVTKLNAEPLRNDSALSAAWFTHSPRSVRLPHRTDLWRSPFLQPEGNWLTSTFCRIFKTMPSVYGSTNPPGVRAEGMLEDLAA